jgi:hypothetical protein
MSFTSDTTGLLDSLSVYVGVNSNRSAELTFSFWTLNGSGMPATLIVTRVLTSEELVANIGANFGLATIDFSTGPLASLATGERYAWTATTTTTGNYDGGPENEPPFSIAFGSGSYSGGIPVGTADGGDNWSESSFLYPFTVTTIVPAPGLAGASLIGLAGLMTRRRR